MSSLLNSFGYFAFGIMLLFFAPAIVALAYGTKTTEEDHLTDSASDDNEDDQEDDQEEELDHQD